jgi:hypothetical protein
MIDMDETTKGNMVETLGFDEETEEDSRMRAAYRERMRLAGMNRHERRKHVAEQRQYAKELVRRERRRAKRD